MALIKISDKTARRTYNHNIIIRNYEHWNRAFKKWDHPTKGRYIRSKADYERALREENMVSEKEAERLGIPQRKEYRVKEDTLALIESVKQTKDKHGNIKPSDRAIEKFIEKTQGKTVSQDNARWLPKHYQPKGGFANDE